MQDEEPSAAASVGEYYVAVDVTGLDVLATGTSYQAVGSVADVQPLAGGGPQVPLVALRSCAQELEVMKDLEEWSVLWSVAQKHALIPGGHLRNSSQAHVTLRSSKAQPCL